ncbi:MAG: hypothetical protein ACFB4I_06385 [Cyanophyceae cyanobacterium]
MAPSAKDFPALCYSIIAAVAFSFCGLRLAMNPYVIQDDARQHVFWMHRLIDSHLFPNDLIADYFQAVAPLGYTSLYRFAAQVGVHPLLLNKILPLMLALAATVYCFKLCHQLFPVPLAAMLSTVLLNQNLWMVDDLSSGTPRAFFYPLFLAFLYYLLKEHWGCLAAIALQGLFYPQAVLISSGIVVLRLLTHQNNRLFLCGNLAMAVATLSFYAAKNLPFGPTITAQVAMQLPEFSATGRAAFFLDNPWSFWLVAPRSGFFPREWPYFLLMSFGCLLPILQRFPAQFPLVQVSPPVSRRQQRWQKQVKPYAPFPVPLSPFPQNIIGQILLASLAVYFLAHLWLFRLHLPSRYTHHSWRLVLALADGMVITIFVDSLSRWLAQRVQLPRRTCGTLLTGIAIAIVLIPTYLVQAYPYRLGYVQGNFPALYQFFQQQPKDITIASLTEEADFIPSFAQRSVLIAQEYAVPYHRGYYRQFRQRVIDTINAQYSQSVAELQDFTAKYEVDFWLLDQSAFSPEYLHSDPWLMQFQPATTSAVTTLEQGTPLLAQRHEECTVFENNNYRVLQAQCILEN